MIVATAVQADATAVKAPANGDVRTTVRVRAKDTAKTHAKAIATDVAHHLTIDKDV